ncbi:aldo/keto reductase family protein [Legionella micdadei]|uniref:Aldo/keto reductase n=1 Tax=Legionella micdadei TaxID=451 RepID=A0A098GBS8_LEGMI|nr:aldo/keto reductase [Legionella micdadei]ARG96250.1 xylose reductase [Legionella micdadei]ARG99006.1 xylose reductase [Legionella micdadei]KTD29064.1 oxidoreductase,aldo/keto reductase family [Legionella micdadei]NSL17272.1 aldo/keto reductase [Legionella micdadei]CEG59427.1 putative oxidoreductase,aldo/keto reductase family [Legionella micdadei]
MVLDRFKRDLQQQKIPAFLYGTAWKEERTQELTFTALNAGFEGIDTANQRRHYFEEGVGLGIQQFLATSGKTRADLFLQTKFTFASGQDHRKPYDESAPIREQVNQSFASSLKHLHTDYIDSYVLHGPLYIQGITEADLQAWYAMEALCRDGQVKFLGVSNVSLNQLEVLCQNASIKPSFVQNRCFAIKKWDKAIREFCAKQGIIYQGFSLLTANQEYLFSPLIRELTTKYNRTIAQILFRFALQVGILPLTGTTQRQHMQEDLDLLDFELSKKEVEQIETICE